jgi:hypothetical protein
MMYCVYQWLIAEKDLLRGFIWEEDMCISVMRM